MSQTKQRHGEYMKAWRRDNAASVAHSLAKVAEARKRIIEAAKDRPCMDCGGNFHSWQMQFDHVDPSTKRFNIGGAYTRSTKDLHEEISKCDVVCANCHADRTHKQGRQAQKESKLQ